MIEWIILGAYVGIVTVIVSVVFWRAVNHDRGVGLWGNHVPDEPTRRNIRWDEHGPYLRFYRQRLRPNYPGAWEHLR